MSSAHQHPSLGASLFGQEPYRPIVIHSIVAVAGIVLVVAGGIFAATISWGEYQLVQDFHVGKATVAQLFDSDDYVQAWSRVLLVVQIVVGIAVLMWVRRARDNAEWFGGPDSQKLTRGWAVFGWICPVVNLWYPYRIVADIWRASALRRPISAVLVLVWWLVFLASGVVNIVGLAEERAFEFETTTQAVEQALRTIATLSTLHAVLSFVAGALIIVIISRIAVWQNTPRDPVT